MLAAPGVIAELATYGPQSRTAWRPRLADARRYCRGLARRHYENFTVASWLLPRKLRPHFYSIYAYCRWADDLADETVGAEESLRLLDWWQRELERCYAGSCEHPVFVALADTIREFAIPIEPFADLLVAFRQDQRVARYDTHDEILAYCRSSANPVGRLVLHLGRCYNEQTARLSDSICTGLQLANFCQDVARDHQRGRVYLPRETLAAAGYDDAMLARRETNESFRRAMQVEVERAAAYLRMGHPLIALVTRALRVDVALFIAGGEEILAAIRRIDYEVWQRRPTVSRRRQFALLCHAWRRSRSMPSEHPA